MRFSRTTLALIVAGAGLALGATPAAAQTYKTVYSFAGGRRGTTPEAGVSAFGGRLFTTARVSGPSVAGVVLSMNPQTGKAKIVSPIRFASSGALTLVGGLFYGATPGTGSSDQGTVYSVDPKTRAAADVYHFTGGDDGSGPNSGLLNVSGVLYGVTGNGGAPNAGTVFSVDTVSGTERIVHAFQGGADGSGPFGNLVEVGGLLYGTTLHGGNSNGGTVFVIDPVTGSERVLHSFGGSEDGVAPTGSLAMVGRLLYGTTVNGGVRNQGTLFSIDPATGIEKVVHRFRFSHGNSHDGICPFSGLTEANGLLYGTTYEGGTMGGNSSGYGTVFSFDPSSRTETLVHSFQGGSDGAFTQSAALTLVGNTLYGTTIAGGGTGSFGGLSGYGTVFAVTLP